MALPILPGQLSGQEGRTLHLGARGTRLVLGQKSAHLSFTSSFTPELA